MSVHLPGMSWEMPRVAQSARVFAHPDDEFLLAGGVLAQHAAGTQVAVVPATWGPTPRARLTVVPAPTAKGLEYDHVVVVERESRSPVHGLPAIAADGKRERLHRRFATGMPAAEAFFGRIPEGVGAVLSYNPAPVVLVEGSP